MRINLFSLSVAALGFASTISATVQNVYINPADDVVCLLLPPKGDIIGNAQTISTAHCTNSTGSANLPSSFFATKQFLVTPTYTQAWGMMNDAAVGLLTSDGGGQYDIHADSGDNRAPGWPVFVELLEPNTGRWCIRFCKALGTDCNMGNSNAGCEGALKITDWPTAPASSNSTVTVPSAGSSASGTKGATTAAATGAGAATGTSGATAAPTASNVPSSGKSSAASSLMAQAPLAAMAFAAALLI